MPDQTEPAPVEQPHEHPPRKWRWLLGAAGLTLAAFGIFVALPSRPAPNRSTDPDQPSSEPR